MNSTSQPLISVDGVDHSIGEWMVSISTNNYSRTGPAGVSRHSSRSSSMLSGARTGSTQTLRTPSLSLSPLSASGGLGGLDWSKVPLVSGPLYLKVEAVWILCDCAVTTRYFTIVPRNPKYIPTRIRCSALEEAKILNYLHFYDNFTFELVMAGVPLQTLQPNRLNTSSSQPTTATTMQNSPFQSYSHSPLSLMFSAGGHSNGRKGSDGTKDSFMLLTPANSSLGSKSAKFSMLPTRSKKSTTPQEAHRSVSDQGHPGGDGYSVVTLKAINAETMFEWIEAFEDIGEGKISPEQQPVKQGGLEGGIDAATELPVFGQGYYELA